MKYQNTKFKTYYRFVPLHLYGCHTNALVWSKNMDWKMLK